MNWLNEELCVSVNLLFYISPMSISSYEILQQNKLSSYHHIYPALHMQILLLNILYNKEFHKNFTNSSLSTTN